MRKPQPGALNFAITRQGCNEQLSDLPEALKNHDVLEQWEQHEVWLLAKVPGA